MSSFMQQAFTLEESEIELAEACYEHVPKGRR